MAGIRCSVVLSVALVLGGLVAPAAATPVFVSSDWLAIGDGKVTRDTATGLEWLDITATAGSSYNYVLSQLGTGGQFSGWRYATDAQVTQLFTDAGVPAGFGNHSATVSANALGFLRNYYGFLSPSTNYYLDFQGLLDGALSNATTATRGLIEAYQVDVFGGQPTTNAGVNWNTFDRNATHPSVGSFLVRDSLSQVPEPATAVLIASGGLLALARLRRRKLVRMSK